MEFKGLPGEHQLWLGGAGMTASTVHSIAEETARVVELAMHFAREGMTDELAGFVDHGLPVDVEDERRQHATDAGRLPRPCRDGADAARTRADVDRRNHRDQSPVAGALFKGEDEVVRLLLGAGADLDAGTPSGRATAEMFEPPGPARMSAGDP